jgi:hypothetical protein
MICKGCEGRGQGIGGGGKELAAGQASNNARGVVSLRMGLRIVAAWAWRASTCPAFPLRKVQTELLGLSNSFIFQLFPLFDIPCQR